LTSASFQPKVIHEQAAMTLLDLGLLVNVQPSLCSTDESGQPLIANGKHSATTRQVPRPMLLEQLLEFTPPRSPRMVNCSAREIPQKGLSEESSFAQTPHMWWPVTPSAEKRFPQAPSILWPATPYEEKGRLRSPTTLWPATPVGERDCPQTPSMLFPATPMAWPTMKQDTRVSSPKQDATGHASIPTSWGKVAVASVPPASLASGFPSRLLSADLISPAEEQREAHTVVDTLSYGQHEWTTYLMDKRIIDDRQT